MTNPNLAETPSERPAQPDHTVAIIQARMGSTRLPGKVLMDIEGEPMLVRVVERVRQSHQIKEVIVATTITDSDDPVHELCTARGYAVYRGSEDDVLDRYYQAALKFNATTIVRLTADCPLIDPGVIDQTLTEFRERGVDFAANRLPPPWKRTFPEGLDVEVCRFEALERAWREAEQRHQREHVMPYFYEEAGRFNIFVLQHDPDYGRYRFSVDETADLELVRQIYRRLPSQDEFSWYDIIQLLNSDPALASLNASVQQKNLWQ